MGYVVTGNGFGMFDALKSYGSLGASAPYYDGVTRLQRGLRDLYNKTGNADYFPGPDDGQLGKDTLAALIRAARDYAGWVAGPGCQSLCNTLRWSAESSCAACIAAVLPLLTAQSPEFPTDPSDHAEIVQAYHQFLAAYIAEFGDGGETDPAQIARREQIALEEAERLAAERRAAADAEEAARLAAAEAARLAAEEEARRRAAAETEPEVQKAGFGWLLGVVIVLGMGGAAVAAYYHNKKRKGGAKALPAYRPGKRGAMDFGGLGGGPTIVFFNHSNASRYAKRLRELGFEAETKVMHTGPRDPDPRSGPMSTIHLITNAPAAVQKQVSEELF